MTPAAETEGWGGRPVLVREKSNCSTTRPLNPSPRQTPSLELDISTHTQGMTYVTHAQCLSLVCTAPTHKPTHRYLVIVVRSVADPLLHVSSLPDREGADRGFGSGCCRHVKLHLQVFLQRVWYLPVWAQLQAAAEGVRVTQCWTRGAGRGGGNTRSWANGEWCYGLHLIY